MKSLGVSTFSATIRRDHSVRRLRRMRVWGNEPGKSDMIVVRKQGAADDTDDTDQAKENSPSLPIRVIRVIRGSFFSLVLQWLAGKLLISHRASRAVVARAAA